MSPISVLLVDDNSTFLGILKDFLQDHGDEVSVVGTASGSEEGLASARTLRPQAVVLDLAMPNLTGLKAIPRFRHMLPDVGIIALSLLDPKTYRQAAVEAGADEFVSKTELTTDLVPAIRRVALAGDTRQYHVGKSSREGDQR